MVTKKRSTESDRRSARERLLAAADELFYEGGIHTVGIDRVIERAGVAKASLYDCFGSKDELIRSYLEGRHEARKARITARLARGGSARERLLAVFDSMQEAMSTPGFRGCAFARVTAETPPSAGVQAVCEDARGWLHELFSALAREAGAADPEALARQLSLLYDGALAASQMGHGVEAARTARATAALLVEAALAAPGAAARQDAGDRAGA
jgi:AcrR family transcriptional regulator